jgi:hypothetical protein
VLRVFGRRVATGRPPGVRRLLEPQPWVGADALATIPARPLGLQRPPRGDDAAVGLAPALPALRRVISRTSPRLQMPGSTFVR